MLSLEAASETTSEIKLSNRPCLMRVAPRRTRPKFFLPPARLAHGGLRVGAQHALGAVRVGWSASAGRVSDASTRNDLAATVGVIERATSRLRVIHRSRSSFAIEQHVRSARAEREAPTERLPSHRFSHRSGSHS